MRDAQHAGPVAQKLIKPDEPSHPPLQYLNQRKAGDGWGGNEVPAVLYTHARSSVHSRRYVPKHLRAAVQQRIQEAEAAKEVKFELSSCSYVYHHLGLPAASRASLMRATMPEKVGVAQDVPATPGVGMRLETTGKPSDIAATSG